MRWKWVSIHNCEIEYQFYLCSVLNVSFFKFTICHQRSDTQSLSLLLHRSVGLSGIRLLFKSDVDICIFAKR
jgi:hypothetical protein